MKTRSGIFFLLLLSLASSARAADEGNETFRFAKSLMLDRQEYSLAANKFAEFVAAHPNNPKAPQAVFNQAECYRLVKNNAKAAGTYAELLAKYPRAAASLRHDAMLLGGHAQYRLASASAGATRSRHYQEAARLYSLLLDKDEPSASQTMQADALYWRGKSYDGRAVVEELAGKTIRAQKLRTRALADFKKIVRVYPTSKLIASAQLSAGIAEYTLGSYDAAASRLQKMVSEGEGDAAKSPRLGDARYYLGESLLSLQKYAPARKTFAEVFGNQRSSYHTEARRGMAWCDYYLKNYKNAARGFIATARLLAKKQAALPQTATTQISSYQQQLMHLHYLAGATFRAGGFYPEAEKELKLVVADPKSPSYASALWELGTMRHLQVRQLPKNAAKKSRLALQADAIKYLAAVLAQVQAGKATLPVAKPELVAMLGEAYLDAKKYAQAATTYALIPARWPQDERVPVALFQQALALREIGKIAAAKEALKKLFTAHPNSPLRLQAAYAMADYQAALGKVKASRGAYGWIVQKGVAWAETLARQRGDNPENAGLIAKAKELAAESLFRLGESYYPEENVAKAKSYYLRVTKEYPQSKQTVMAQYRLGEIAKTANDPKQAEKLYREVIAQAKAAGKAARQHALFSLADILYRRALRDNKSESRTATLNEAEKNLAILLAEKPAGEMLLNAQFQHAEVLYALDRKADALTDYQAAAAVPGKGLDERLFGLAWCYLDLKKIARAQETFSAIVTRFPQSEYAPKALYVRGISKKRHGDYPAALADFAQLLKAYPKSEVARKVPLKQAEVLGVMNRHNEAIAKLTAFVQAHPQSKEAPDALQVLAREWATIAEPKVTAARKAEDAYLGASGDKATELKAVWEKKRAAAKDLTDKQMLVLKKLIKDFPTYGQIDAAYFNLGEIEYGRKSFDAALISFKAALQASRQNPGSDTGDKSLYRIAMCQLRLGEAAVWSYAQSFAKDASVAGNLATTRENLQKEEHRRKTAALKTFQALSTQYPHSELTAEAFFRSAELLREKKRYQEANGQYRQAIAAAPKAWFARAALFGIGASFLEAGKYSEALQVCKKFLATYPVGEYTADANWGAGQACLGLQAYADAKNYFEAVLAADKESEAAAKSRLGLGLILFAKEKWEAAREEFLKVDTFHSQWATPTALALLKSSQAASKLGEKESAKKDLIRLLAKYPYAAIADEARQALAALR